MFGKRKIEEDEYDPIIEMPIKEPVFLFSTVFLK